MSPSPNPAQIDSRVRAEMRRLVRRIQAGRLHGKSALAWLACAAAVALTFGLAWLAHLPAPVLMAAIGAEFLICAWLVARWWREPIHDYAAAAAVIEQTYPELGHALRTAIEQRPDASGQYSFLQTRLLTQVLDHAYRHFWSRSPLPRARRAALAHGLALVGACALAAAATRWQTPARSAHPAPGPAIATGLEITPGDAEVERGSTVIITARFGDAETVPAEVSLHWRTPDGTVHRQPMARSLADPVFARTLPHVASDFTYSVVFGAHTSATHAITVYELPRMTRGDAALTYPEFSGLAPKTIEDTRRVSAVEGSQLDYIVHTNKPVREATLQAADGTVLALEPAAPEGTRFRLRMPVSASARYTVHLVDQAGRKNPDPPELRIEALPNRRPELKLTFPRGDQRVSALEEIPLEASAADDFGLLDYGIAWSVAGAEPHYESLRTPAQRPATGDTQGKTEAREASFRHLLSLETAGVEPAQVVTWFAWADDRASDGQPRRTTGDLYFAEIRPFDEIFRESEGGGGAQQQGGAGGEAAELLEMQRDISLAIWKLRNGSADTDAFHEDVSTVHDAQGEVRQRLAEARAQLNDRALQAAAHDAARHMERAEARLDESREESSTDPLNEAWTASQGAYQALLRMQPAESQVGQERNARGGQQGGRANQRQLDQLRFKDDADRYETESQAQLSSTPEQREQMQTLARLRELARRQADLNERLQELQTALEAARDEAERDEIRRELKRLEEEQRRMLADVDELRQRMDQQSPGTQTAQARDQVEQTREDMRRASESLQEGAVSRALASGTRAQENLEEARENLREESASQFSEQMRELRREARDLAEAQARAEQELAENRQRTAPSLDDSNQRDDLAEAMEQNREALETLTSEMRRVTEQAEEAEPGLYRQLYDLLREQGQGGGAGDRMETAAELLRRGFVDQARELQPQITESVNRLARGVERAAESVLGDEASTMRFAQAELDELARSVRNGEADASEGRNPTDDTSDEPGEGGEAREPRGASEPGTGEGDGAATLNELLAELGRAAGDESARARDNPITGEGFGAWEERLRTVESLLEDPGARERLAQARELAAELRREFRRDGSPPLSTTIESGIVAPLSEIRAWLRQELARREDPASLQPIDRDPVPEGYAEAVQRYYEALGE